MARIRDCAGPATGGDFHENDCCRDALAPAVTSSLPPRAAHTWGDDGHKAVTRIAEQVLTQAAKKPVGSLLADTDALTNAEHRSYVAYLAPPELPAFASRLPALAFTRDPTGVSG
jgi:hypothetical protein